MAKESLVVRVYVPAGDARSLRAEGKDPAEWVRGYIRYALTQRKEKAGV